ncbi:MAG: DUF1761 domain-containing protein [Actinomycetales bacterium]
MPEINWIAVISATVAAFIVGFIWFGPKTFYPVWFRALGRSPQDRSSVNPATLFVPTIVATFVQALGVAIVIGLRHGAGTHVGPVRGLLIGGLIGVVFAAAPSLSHRLFAGQGYRVWAIEAGGDVAGLAAMGLVIGAFNGLSS